MAHESCQHERNWGARITEYTYRGYPTVVLENRALRVAVVAGKGTDILEFLYKPADVDFMWRRDLGLRPFHNQVPTIPCPSGSFIDFYAGGWQELLPNAGMNCVYKGAPLGAHGEVCLQPWEYQIERDDPDGVAVTFRVRTSRTPFYLEKRLGLDRETPVLTIDEVVRNEGDEILDFMWGHHPAFGWPFLDESCRLFVPECRVRTPEDYTAPASRLEKGQDAAWPLLAGRDGASIDLRQIAPPGARAHDMAYLYGFREGWYCLLNQRLQVGFGLRWDPATFPSLWFWQLYRGGYGFPWFGRNYTVALEPVSSYPPTLTDAIAAGTQLTLEPGQDRRTRLLAVAVAGQTEINRITEDGAVD